MKWWRIRKVASATGWQVIFFAIGLLGGVALVAFLPGMPWSTTVEPLGMTSQEALDLAAQRSMAAAAWWMVVLTTAAGAVGAFSLWLIRENLLAAREVNRHAERSAKAAEDAVAAAIHTAQITQKMGQAQTRCYLVVKSAAITVYTDTTYRLEYSFLNSGQTPARVVEVATEVWLELSIPDRGWIPLALKHRISKSRSDIPGQEARKGSTYGEPRSVLDEQTLRDVLRYQWRILVDITLTYTDVFGERRKETAYYGIAGEPEQQIFGHKTLYRIHR